MYRSAVMRELAVVGEAAGALSDQFAASHPELPWKQIRGFRNRAVHSYWDTDWAVIEDIVSNDLPRLRDVAQSGAAPAARVEPTQLADVARRRRWAGSPPARQGDGERCNAWMPIARTCCALEPGHRGHHRASR